MMGRTGCWIRRMVVRAAGLLGLLAGVALVIAPAGWARGPTPSIDIQSAGPLSNIWIGNELSCQVEQAGEATTEFYPGKPGPGDCGTLLFVNTADHAERLSGPNFHEHAAGTHAPYPNDDVRYRPFRPVSQSLIGSGTAASPYQLTTVVTVHGAHEALDLQITEVDSYVVGNDFYDTELTVKNIGRDNLANGFQLYHAADCFLRGSDDGFGSFAQSTHSPACTINANDSPASAFEEFNPLTSGNHGIETSSPEIWSDLEHAEENLADTCDCATNENNAEGIGWSVPGSFNSGDTSPTFSFQTVIDYPILATGTAAVSGNASSAVSGTVAAFTDPETTDTSSQFTATINWGDGSFTIGTVAGGSGTFTVAGSHTYVGAGVFSVSVTIQKVGDVSNRAVVKDTATIRSAPAPVTTGAPLVGSTGAAFTGSVDPDGLPTTAFFQYGLDPKYTGGGPVVYDQSTPAQSVGSDFTTHQVSASVSGLLPGVLYHVRIVATNSAGTTFGPDVTFTTAPAPAPGSPALGRTFTISIVSGVVLVKIHGVFVPVTHAMQIPNNTEIDALHGTIKLSTAVSGAHPAQDAAAGGRKHKTKAAKSQSGTFGGAIFKISQAGSGLVTLALIEGAFPGAPSYASCTNHKAAQAAAAAVSSKTLQLLHASAKGNFRTRGRYSAATVRGTKWTIADKCNGTLTHDLTDSVAVRDFVRHKTIILHAGQSYLARAPTHHK